MEGTVTISLLEFDLLKSFKSSYLNGGAIRIHDEYDGYAFLTKEEAIEYFKEDIESKSSQIKVLDRELKNVNTELNRRDYKISELEGMTVREFRRYKKGMK